MTPRTLDVGIALSERRICAWLPHESGRRWERPLAPRDSDSDGWPELASALAELAERIDGAPRLHVALLPPAGQVRCVALPRMRQGELLHVLRRDLQRFFPLTGDVVVGAARLSGRGAGLPIVAAIAPESLLMALHAAADAAGAEVERVIPAHAAWRAAALATWPTLRAGRSVLLVRHADGFDVFELADGWPRGYRRLAASSSAARLRELIGGGEACVPPIGYVGDRRTAAELEASGLPLLAGAPSEWEAEVVAARFATATRAPELVLEQVKRRRAADERQWIARLGAATLFCLIVAGALELWGTAREAAALERQRSAIRVSVERAVTVRDSATVVADRLAALDSLERTSPRWSELVTMLAARLPDDAYLLSLRAEGDSASLDGVAESAADVVSALRAAPEVAAVRADAPIRQELGAGGALVERFALTLRLVERRSAPRGSTVAQVGAP